MYLEKKIVRSFPLFSPPSPLTVLLNLGPVLFERSKARALFCSFLYLQSCQCFRNGKSFLWTSIYSLVYEISIHWWRIMGSCSFVTYFLLALPDSNAVVFAAIVRFEITSYFLSFLITTSWRILCLALLAYYYRMYLVQVLPRILLYLISLFCGMCELYACWMETRKSINYKPSLISRSFI